LILGARASHGPYAGHVTDVGRAEVQVTGDVRNFARQAEADLNRALSKIDLGKSSQSIGRSMGRGVTKGAEDELSGGRGRISGFLKKAFTPDPGMFAALRAPFAAALSTPITAAVITVAGTAALAFVAAFGAAIATAGLGAVFLGLGAAALFGARKSREDAQKDLDAAEERVRKAEQRAQSGTAASKRSLADARAELAKTQEQVANNQAFVKLDSSLSKLGDTLKRVGQNASQPLMGPFTQAIGILDKALVRIEPLLTNIFSGLAPAIGPLTEGMAGFVEEFLKVINEDPATIEAMRDALIAIGSNLPRLGTLLGQVFQLFSSNENNVRNIGLLFGVMELTIGSLAGSILVLSKALDGIIIGWNAVKTAGSSAIAWITGTAVPAIVQFASMVGQAFAPLASIVAGVWQVISAVVQTALALIGNAVFIGMKFVQGTIKAISSAISGDWRGTWEGIKTTVSAILNGIRTAVSIVLSGIRGVISGALVTIRAAWSAGWNAMVAVVTGAASRVRSAVSGLRSAVIGAFSGASGWLVSAGRRIIDGLISGIRAGFGRVQSVLSALTASLPSWKGPESVDERILRESGRLVMQGFERGLESQFASVRKTLGDLTGNLPSFTAGQPRGGDGASLGNSLSIGEIHVHVAGATGTEAGQQAAEAILNRLGAATLAR
jgi:phage-related protein